MYCFRSHYIPYAVFIIFSFLILTSALSYSATFTVDDLNDGAAMAGDCEADMPPVGSDCSIRDAVAAANGDVAADEILFDGGLVLPGVITLTEGQMTISEDLIITGPGADMLTIDAANNCRIFEIESGDTVSISGVRFINGDTTSGGAINNGGNLSIESCVFEENNSANRVTGGGAIFNNGTIGTILNSTFTGNEASAGGAIFNNGSINISFTTITDNTADDGGGIFEVSGFTTNIRNSIVAFNSPDNCISDIATEAGETGNYSDDESCGFDNDNAFILVGVLSNSGGPTQTVPLVDGDPLDGAAPGCDPLDENGMASGISLTTDQRSFPRPMGASCDSGAFESTAATPTTLVNVEDEPPGANCEFGGVLVETGPDSNSNGVLDDGEVENTYFICNGVTELVEVTTEPPGTNCEFGGVIVETGPDTNQNNILDDDEVDTEEYICNGEPGNPGAPGPQGPVGPEGDDGSQGPMGEDGLTSQTDLNLEPAGSNCTEGGVRIDTGLDLNMNGVLEPNEITQTSFICNGEEGSNCSLIRGKAGKNALYSAILPFALILLIMMVRRRI